MNIPAIETGTNERLDEEKVVQISTVAHALSDPIRVGMLSMMAAGRECCSIPDCGVPDGDKDAGICVCEFERTFGLGQSKVSYHMKKLKDAGLVHEEKRGRWSYYSLRDSQARWFVQEIDALLLTVARS